MGVDGGWGRGDTGGGGDTNRLFLLHALFRSTRVSSKGDHNGSIAKSDNNRTIEQGNTPGRLIEHDPVLNNRPG